MRFLVDENFPRAAVLALRELGHDTTWVRETTPGAPDEEVTGLAVSESRVLITWDKDFGELIVRAAASTFPGVMLFRMPVLKPEKLATLVATVVGSRSDWSGCSRSSSPVACE